MSIFKHGDKVLAFFAHPDDETLGAGGTLAKLCDEGYEVHIAIAATGITSRDDSDSSSLALHKLEQDLVKAAGVLGVPANRVTLGAFRDNQMDSYPLLEIIKWLEAIIRSLDPQVLITHHRYCTNIDHQICHEAAVVATRPNVEKQINLLCCEVPSSTGYLRPAAFEPNLYVRLNRDNLDAKLNAMKAYESERRAAPHPRSDRVLEALAIVRGSESGFDYAEAFMIQKSFQSA